MTQIDFLIVGRGLAGTLLASELEKRGRTFRIIDNPDAGSASRVALGIWNPVGFRTCGKTWMADMCLKQAMSTYQEFETFTGYRLLYPMDIIRLHPDAREREIWMEKMTANTFLGLPLNISSALRAPFGAGTVTGSGRLDLTLLLNLTGDIWQKEGQLIEAEFQQNKLAIEDEMIRYENKLYGCVVFCNGIRAAESSLFGWLPLIGNKGEVLEVVSECKDLSFIVNNGKISVPMGNGVFRIGSTYQNNPKTVSVTQDARVILSRAFESAMGVRCDTRTHKAGIRPTVIDRRPVMGVHPEQNHVFLFNGLGTRGVLIAPLMAVWMARLLIDGTPLSREVDLMRFKSYYPERTLLKE